MLLCTKADEVKVSIFIGLAISVSYTICNHTVALCIGVNCEEFCFVFCKCHLPFSAPTLSMNEISVIKLFYKNGLLTAAVAGP